MIMFDDFTPGESFGAVPVVIDQDMILQWGALFPDDLKLGAEMPVGLTSAVAMNAYLELVAPRPPGNVHASQAFEMHKLPKFGDTIQTEVLCLSKELHKGRRWVELGTKSCDQAGELMFTGRMKLIWAA